MNKLFELKKSLAILLIFISYSSLISQIDYRKVNKQRLSEIIPLIEEKNAITFSYNNKLIEQYKISYLDGRYSLNEILDLVFKQTPLKYEFVDTSHVIISKKIFDGEQLCGYIIDKLSQVPLEGATISDIHFKKGEITDENGYFEYFIEDKFEKLICSYLGYKDLEIKINSNSTANCQQYELYSKTYIFPEITLTEYLDDGISVTKDANQIVLTPEDMSMLPGNVENNIFSAVQFLPGINSPTESLDRIHIRGSTPDQNLILWDDIPIYSTSHLFGAINGFNPFMVESVNVYRNGVSSKYGGRVSGVIDIHSKSSIPNKINGGIGFNMTQLHTEIEIPIFKKSALFLSGRFSLTESWNTPTFQSYADKVFQSSQIATEDFEDIDNTVKFNDVTAKWIYQTKRDIFEISLLGSLNNLEYKTAIPQFKAFAIDFLDSDHSGSKIGWTRNWNSYFNSELIITNTQFTNKYSRPIMSVKDPSFSPIKQEYNNDLQEGNLRLGFNWKFHENKWVRFGYQYTQDDIDLNWSSKNFDELTENSEFFENRLHALYSEYSMDLPDVLHLNIGLRYHYSPVLKNEYFEPRIGVTANITDKLKLKLSTSKHFQFVSQLVILDTNQLGLANQIWVVSDNINIPVIESNQWTGGLIYIKDKWTIEGEAYVKELAGLTSLSDSFDPTINVPYSRGAARISGIDLLMKKRFTFFKSWLSYSFSKANYEFFALNPESFPATYDQRHVLRWVNLFKQNKWEYSFGLTYKSGLPFTDAISLQNNSIQFSELNSSRLGSYLRLDASVLYQFKNKAESYVAFSLQNIGNRTNILARQFRKDQVERTEESRLVKFDTVGLGFTPNLSINFMF